MRREGETVNKEIRHQCAHFMQEKTLLSTICLPKSEFDDLYKRRVFVDGPYRDSFGDNSGEPYTPDRQAFGLISGPINGSYVGVYCEISSSF
jgi:hypothetical protein